MTKKVCLYLRCSQMKQVHSIERQLEELKEVCKNHDWEIVDTYIDEGEIHLEKLLDIVIGEHFLHSY